MEIQLTRQMASIEATVRGFAIDVNRRFDEQVANSKELRDDVRAIKTEMHNTTSRVNKHDEQIDALKVAVERPMRQVKLLAVVIVSTSSLLLAVIKGLGWGPPTSVAPATVEALRVEVEAGRQRDSDSQALLEALQRQLDQINAQAGRSAGMRPSSATTAPAFPRDERFVAP